MRAMRWVMLAGWLVAGCAEATAPKFQRIRVTCTLVQLPDGTMVDRCVRLK